MLAIGEAHVGILAAVDNPRRATIAAHRFAIRAVAAAVPVRVPAVAVAEAVEEALVAIAFHGLRTAPADRNIDIGKRPWQRKLDGHGVQRCPSVVVDHVGAAGLHQEAEEIIAAALAEAITRLHHHIAEAVGALALRGRATVGGTGNAVALQQPVLGRGQLRAEHRGSDGAQLCLR